MKKILIAAALAVALAGCTQQYHLEGVVYPNAQTFLSANQTMHGDGVEMISPLPQPVTKKNLVMAIPSEQALYAQSLAETQRRAGGAAVNVETVKTMATASYLSIAAFGKATQRRNIYPNVTFIDMDSASGSITATEQADALYLTKQDGGSPQWFYVSAKGGKQIFAYDRSAPGVAGKLKAFADAVQVQAIRE